MKLWILSDVDGKFSCHMPLPCIPYLNHSCHVKAARSTLLNQILFCVRLRWEIEWMNRMPTYYVGRSNNSEGRTLEKKNAHIAVEMRNMRIYSVKSEYWKLSNPAKWHSTEWTNTIPFYFSYTSIAHVYRYNRNYTGVTFKSSGKCAHFSQIFRF